MEVEPHEAEALDELVERVKYNLEYGIEHDHRLKDIKKGGLVFAVLLRCLVEDMKTRHKSIQKDLISVAYTSMKLAYDEEPGK